MTHKAIYVRRKAGQYSATGEWLIMEESIEGVDCYTHMLCGAVLNWAEFLFNGNAIPKSAQDEIFEVEVHIPFCPVCEFAPKSAQLLLLDDGSIDWTIVEWQHAFYH